MVRLGRYAYAPGIFSKKCGMDNDMVELALEKTGMTAQRKQSVLTLSGGELQRTFLAQVFAQDPKYLLLDEPTNHLDLVYQRQAFSLTAHCLGQQDSAALREDRERTLAKAYGTKALLLSRGRAAALGPIEEALSRRNLEQVYSMDVYAYMREMLGQWQ